MMHLHFRRKTCGNHPYHLHTRQAGRAIAQCLTGRKGCAIDPYKTEDGNYISAYACDPHTADAEFLLSKRQHKQLAGRTQYSNVIAYQVRQSFRPGEIPPEEPNQVGDEFVSRFLQGQHAFIRPLIQTASISTTITPNSKSLARFYSVTTISCSDLQISQRFSFTHILHDSDFKVYKTAV